MVIFLYESLVVGVLHSTAFILKKSIDVVKNNLNIYEGKLKNIDDSFVDKNHYINSIKKMAELENKNQLIKYFKAVQNYTEGFAGAAASLFTSASPILNMLKLFGIIGVVFLVIRSLIFEYYNSRIKLSNYLKYIKDFILMNSSTLGGTDSKKIKEKQEKIASSFDKLADKIAIDQDLANDKANYDIQQSNNQLSIANSQDSSSNLDIF